MCARCVREYLARPVFLYPVFTTVSAGRDDQGDGHEAEEEAGGKAEGPGLQGIFLDRGLR